MKSLVHLAFGEKIPDCKKCAREPRLRREFGCDEPTERPIYSVSCSGCDGTDPECTRCLDGATGMHRCPGKLLDAHADGRRIGEAFNLCVQYQQHGIMPVAGGMMDQTQAFLSMLRVFQHEHGLIARDKAEQADKDRRRQEARARRGSISGGMG